ncbi:hypothetical protein DRW57_02000, partial [Metamycoplasma hominis]
ANKKIA